MVYANKEHSSILLHAEFFLFPLKWYLKCNSIRDMKRFAFRIKGQLKHSAGLGQESIPERMNTAKFF